VLDYCVVACMPDRAFVVTSPSTAQLLMQQLNFLIIREQVSLSDLVAAGASGCFSLAGAGADQALGKVLGDAKLLPQAGKAVVASVGGHDVVVVHGSGLASEGYLLIASSSAAAPLWEELLQAGAIGEGYRGYEAQRISDGVPAAGSELTLDYNPLEAGLWSAVSFEKGCYCGQETLARLRTYDGVKQHLVMSPHTLPHRDDSHLCLERVRFAPHALPCFDDLISLVA
jgi:folate-binding protein YgfZ